ncbi:hypothetical protein [Mongoliitalea daihaiensis]|uniref:hypothetical protein n=1 Tax=Mongoliitalea daihaiensis TaxID=2782006 RepID=UPI001F29C539|nr:hypothetical protein [Mongoliitalea daihaiensis]UJP63999.1 hypothetical protein IPZ59_14370 [Mongoliitalea daihaiensis]
MFRNQKYDYSDAATIEDVLPDEFCDSLEIKSYQVKAIHNRGKRVKRRLVRSVFYDFLNLLIDDLMETNNRFVSPSKNYFMFYIKEKSFESVRRIYKNGIYKAVDPVLSNGKIYEYFMEFHMGSKVVRRPVRISYRKYMELVKKVNKGKRYHR